MNFSRSAKLFIGLGTLLVAVFPFLMMAFAFLPFFLTFPIVTTGGEPDPEFFGPFFGSFFLIFPVMICMSFLLVVMQIFYIIQIVKNNAASEIVRILTGVGLYFLPFVAMPVYYFIYILPEKPPDWALETA